MIIMTSNTDDGNADYCGEKVDVEIFCLTGHRSINCFFHGKDLGAFIMCFFTAVNNVQHY